MQTISVFLRINGPEQRALIQARRQRQLQKDAVYRGISIQSLNGGENLIRRCGPLEMRHLAGNSNPLTGFVFVGDIHRTGRVIADP